jgi:hypothetical protein
MENKEIELHDMPTRIKELEFIQSVITRLSDRQQSIKYACWTFLAAIFGASQVLSASNFTKLAAFVSSALLIWSFRKIDLNFLKMEKLYRIWYDFICWKRSETCQWLFELNPKNIKQILKEESTVFSEFDPSIIESESKKSWSLTVYFWSGFSICLLYAISLLV